MAREKFTDGDIHTIRPDRSKVLSEGFTPLKQNEERGYTQGGSEVDVDSPKCFCKVVNFGGNAGEQCFVRCDSAGSLYDPWGLYSEGRASQFNKTKGTDLFPFTNVGFEIFELYLRFLQTRNRANLLNAQRKLR